MLDFSGYPARPPSVGAWEELLVRYEVAPRALRLAVADAPPACAAELLMPLGLLLSAELMAAEALEAMREGRAVAGGGFGVEDAGEGGTQGLVAAYATLRARNFAALQRRGVDVWEWCARWGEATVTPFRLVSAAAAVDGALLDAVRAAARGETHFWDDFGGAPC